jgi:hypothetical protein
VTDAGVEAPHEWKLRLGAVPAAVAIAVLFHGCEPGHFLQRSALTMPLHELGHAAAAWWCGYGAIPGLWRTLIPDERSAVVALLALAAGGALLWRGWITARLTLGGAGLGLIALQFVGTAAWSPRTAHAAITFAGDAGAMIFGAALMATFFAAPGSRLRAGGLRFGLLSIGAGALVDAFATWWRARTDPDAIPFGEIEGVGASDPSRLDEVYGWSVDQIVGRYVAVGALCIAALAVAWVVATWRARAAAAPN